MSLGEKLEELLREYDRGLSEFGSFSFLGFSSVSVRSILLVLLLLLPLLPLFFLLSPLLIGLCLRGTEERKEVFFAVRDDKITLNLGGYIHAYVRGQRHSVVSFPLSRMRTF